MVKYIRTKQIRSKRPFLREEYLSFIRVNGAARRGFDASFNAKIFA